MNIEELFLKFSLLGAQWVLWLLVVLSLISVAIMVERAVTFYKLRSNGAELGFSLRRYFRRGDLDGALSFLRKERGLEAAVAAAGLQEADRGSAAVEETMESVKQQERVALEKNVSFLGTVGSNAPFIGLFGTVLGIIKAFNTLAGAESANFKLVMADISEALVATGVGLLVAIPAVVAFNIINRRVQRLMANSASVEHLVLAYVKGEPVSPPDPEAVPDTPVAQTTEPATQS